MTDFRAQTTLNRGMRNNNPGNIVKGDNWLGSAGDDGTFMIFVDDTWGIRALATVLANKINNDGLTTITEIITSYAPPSENDTTSYITEVSADTGFDPDQELTADPDTLFSLSRAIINREEGYTQSQMITDADITTGIGMMGSGVSTLAAAASVAAGSLGTSTMLIWIAVGLGGMVVIVGLKNLLV